jgi:CBS-domain-containing membrane protein
LDVVAATMLENNVPSVAVLDDHGIPCGILTERDFTAHEPANPFQRHRPTQLFGHPVRSAGLTNLYSEARSITAGKAARGFAGYVTEHDPIERAVDIMTRHDVVNVPVLRNGKVVGMIGRRDFLRLAAQEWMQA